MALPRPTDDQRLGPVALLVTLGLLEAGLVALGGGVLAAPPMQGDAALQWVSTGDPLLHAAAIARLVALAAGAWHVVTLLAVLGLRSVGRVELAARAARSSPAVVRRAVERSGAAIVAGGLTVAGPLALPLAATEAPPSTTTASAELTAVMHWEPVDAPTPSAPTSTTITASTNSTTTSTSTSTGGPVTSSSAPPSSTSVALDSPTAEAKPPPAPPAAPVPMAPPPVGGKTALNTPTRVVARHDAGSTWTVVRGEHLWGIAADVVAARSVAVPSADDVADYWLVLIEANRSRLVDPTNPDLIHAGLVLTLP